MHSLVIIHPKFDAIWPFAGDDFAEIWGRQGALEVVRLAPDDERNLGQVANNVVGQAETRRIAALGVPVTRACLDVLPQLREIAIETSEVDATLQDALEARGIARRKHGSEGFWGQSVAEFALGLTLCALRRIPQTHAAVQSDPCIWEYEPAGGRGRPGARGQQFGDAPAFANGTVAGKRVRVVGAGNIGSRYAAFCNFLGAEVRAWDPYAPEPCFHRAGARRERDLATLVSDAQILAALLPLTDATRGLLSAALIDALPQGCLVVLSTRADICDMQVLRRRVLRGELSLAADVFDVEPLPPDDPLLGLPHVVHTPHNAGRTRQANSAWAQALCDEFSTMS